MSVDNVSRYHIPSLNDYLSNVPQYLNRFVRTNLNEHTDPCSATGGIIRDDEAIFFDIARGPKAKNMRSFVRAGMRKYIKWAPGEVRAAIVTCGGLCPGLNDVVQELVRVLFCKWTSSRVCVVCVVLRCVALR
jgi:6-phosphofructokinase 1